MTNREWLVSLDDKHFAESLSELIDDRCVSVCEFDIPGKFCFDWNSCSHIILKWLGEAHKEDEDDS